MGGEGAIPDAESRSGRVGARWGLTCESFMVTFAFENGTIAKDDAILDNRRVFIVVVFGSIQPCKWGKEIKGGNDIGVLVCIIALFDTRWQCMVVENVSRRCDTEDRRRNSSGSCRWSCGTWGKGRTRDIIEVKAIEGRREV